MGNVHFTKADNSAAHSAYNRLVERYGQTPKEKAKTIVALGGDGFMLRTLHENMGTNLPVYGINCGSIGFLLNDYYEEDLLSRLEAARVTIIHPLRMSARKTDGSKAEALAINEVSLLRETAQTANIRISVDGKVRMETLMCDGVIVATPAGSTAYNFSANGPILPIGSQMLALTPISAFRPRRWGGALLPANSSIILEVKESRKRTVSAVADMVEVRDVSCVEVEADHSVQLKLLFDPGRALEEKVIQEQFSH